MNMMDDVKEILLTEQDIKARIRDLGDQISADYAGKDLVLVTILKGAVMFLSDLMRHITVPCEIDFMVASSYGASTSSAGVIKVLKDIDIPLSGRNILIVEDILDSGLTLSHIRSLLESRNPASVKIVTLLDKPARRTVDLHADYLGFEIPDKFVIGYGLDYDEKYRNLPFIGVLKPEVYTS